MKAYKFKLAPSVRLQRFLDWLFFPIQASLLILVFKYYARFRIYNHDKIRKQYKEICKERGEYPLLICPNHLTMIDSIIIEWALGGILWYWFNFKNFAWNIPAKENFKTNIYSRVITYLGKCIPIERKGTKEHIEYVMNQVQANLERGEAFLIFPEGTRSRTGKVEVEDITYGVGKIVQELGKVAVLCVYLRGDKQVTYSNFPEKDQSFYLKMELIWPTTKYDGVRGQKDLSLQIGKKLKELENEYFDLKSNQVNV